MRFFYCVALILTASIFVNCSQNIHTHAKPYFTTKGSHKNIGIVFASYNIKRYAINLQNMAISYALSQNPNINLTFKDIKKEKTLNLNKALKELNELKVKKIILLITENFKNKIDFQNGAFDDFDIVYLPVSKKHDDTQDGKNIFYGSIDYEAQIDALLQIHRNDTNIVSLYEKNKVSKELDKILHSKANVSKSKQITSYTRGYIKFLKSYKGIDDSTIFLNTNQEKSAIALSQITTHNINATIILSTQINFSPKFLSTTQSIDRQKLIVANSIPNISPKTTLINDIELLYPNIMDNWVSYSILIGLEFLDKGEVTSFENIAIKDNSVIYPIDLFYYTNNKYIKLDKFSEQEYANFNNSTRELRWDSFHKLHKEYIFE